MSIQTLKKLARTRLCEGRLIKTKNEYTPDHKKIKALLSQKSDKGEEYDNIRDIVIKECVYIGFDELLSMLLKNFKKFLQANNQNPYIFVFKADKNKSDIWIILLLLRYGRKFLKSIYKDPDDIIELAKLKFEENLINRGEKIHYVFCDDVIYSGTQMFYNLENMRLKYSNDYTLPNTSIICAGISSYALKRFKWLDSIYYDKHLKSFMEIVSEDPSKFKFKNAKLTINAHFPQPFEERIDHSIKIPVYLETKMPDIVSSFPDIYISIVRNCKWDANTRIEDGSSEKTMCANPFYKSVNFEKGNLDKKNEKKFICHVMKLYNA